MSVTLATLARPEATKRPAAFTRLVCACWDAMTRYFVRRAAVASLRALDDHVLRDIGLERSQIKAAVEGGITPFDQGKMPCSPWT